MLVTKGIRVVWLVVGGCGGVLGNHGLWDLKVAGIIPHILHPSYERGVRCNILTNWRERGREGGREREGERERGREREREGGRKGGRKEERKGGREGGERERGREG